ncbi:hypothetical protein H0O00_02880 [Candidatus Micrarchaeota archaeon]|nr:hypothetical protein [Candidatus Micrarchaeota archaeon]
MKVTLTHIGAIALGRLMAVWSFVLGLIGLVLWVIFSIIAAIIGLVAGTDMVAMIVGLAIPFVMGIVGLFVMAIVMFIAGFIIATVYNVILGVGGGIDLDFKER